MALPGLPLALPPGQLEALRAAYVEPPRAYHDFSHVTEVMQRYLLVAEGPAWQQPREVALAVLYHDAIYVAGKSDNEARSAQLAMAGIERWLPDAGIDAQRVAYLIELTARHGRHAPSDFDDGPAPDDVRNFLDCDMAILGATPDAFDDYDRAIAQEYDGVLPGWLFRLNRRKFLRGLLARERIFLGDFFHLRLEEKARRNLRRALGKD